VTLYFSNVLSLHLTQKVFLDPAYLLAITTIFQGETLC
jgi:hypothetical protein